MNTLPNSIISFLLIKIIFLFSFNVLAQQELENCYKSNVADFFSQELETLSAEGKTPVLLLNESKEVVGYISASPNRSENYPHMASTVEFNMISLCSNIEVKDFHYIDSEFNNLLNWVKSSSKTIEISQDEGMLLLKFESLAKDHQANLIKFSYKAYDVFDSEDSKNQSHQDYLKDFGLPKGKGYFYVYFPKIWIKK
jgi:hypothetical protein